MSAIHRLLPALGLCCLWANGAQAAASAGQIEARLVITAGCEVRQNPADGKPAVSCGATPRSPTQYTVSTRDDVQGDGRHHTLVTLNW